MIMIEIDIMDGLGPIDVVVTELLAANRLRQFTRDADGAFSDQERWEKVSLLMTHEHAGPHVGWTLGMVLPGDSPDDAIDSYGVPK